MRFQAKFICFLGNKSRCGTRLCILLNYVEQAEDKHRRLYSVKVYAVVSQCVTKENKYCTPVIGICLEVEPEAWHLDMNHCLYESHYL